MVEVSGLMVSKRSELANILRGLADYVDRRSDEDLAPILRRAGALMQRAEPARRDRGRSRLRAKLPDVRAIATELQTLPTRESGDALLRDKAPNRTGLGVIARYLQLPVQGDDTVKRLRAKIVENTIGSRLRSDAIQGKNR